MYSRLPPTPTWILYVQVIKILLILYMLYFTPSLPPVPTLTSSSSTVSVSRSPSGTPDSVTQPVNGKRRSCITEYKRR